MTEQPPEVPSSPVPPDKRKNLRSPLLALKIRLDDDRRVFFGYTKNLSCSGMFVATLKPLEPGQQIRVEIPLPPPLDRTLQCICEVVWVRPFRKSSRFEPGAGMKFIDLDPRTAAAIDAWIRDTG